MKFFARIEGYFLDKRCLFWSSWNRVYIFCKHNNFNIIVMSIVSSILKKTMFTKMLVPFRWQRPVHTVPNSRELSLVFQRNHFSLACCLLNYTDCIWQLSISKTNIHQSHKIDLGAEYLIEFSMRHPSNNRSNNGQLQRKFQWFCKLCGSEETFKDDDDVISHCTDYVHIFKYIVSFNKKSFFYKGYISKYPAKS